MRPYKRQRIGMLALLAAMGISGTAYASTGTYTPGTEVTTQQTIQREQRISPADGTSYKERKKIHKKKHKTSTKSKPATSPPFNTTTTQ